MVDKKFHNLISLALKLVLNLVIRLFRRMRFTSHEVAGKHQMEGQITNKTSVSISGEYRKEENTRNGNSSRT